MNDETTQTEALLTEDGGELLEFLDEPKYLIWRGHCTTVSDAIERAMAEAAEAYGDGECEVVEVTSWQIEDNLTSRSYQVAVAVYPLAEDEDF